MVKTDRRSGLLLGSALFLLGMAVLSLLLGSVSLTPVQFLAALRGTDRTAGVILLQVRLPRTAAALLAGAGLSAAGAIIQTVLHNPLAGPNLMGVNAGAGLCYVLFGALLPGCWQLAPLAALLGALGAMGLVFLLASRTRLTRIGLVLAGVAVNALLNAAIDAVETLVPDALQNGAAFRVGGVDGLSWNSLLLPAPLILAALAAALLLRHELDVLSLGTETAQSLGLPARRFRLVFLVLASVLAGASVSFAGLLGFLGLIVPHIARLFLREDSRLLLPVSALLGGGLLTGCDVLARVLFAPFELPVGILLSFLGAPFFLWLLMKRGRGV